MMAATPGKRKPPTPPKPPLGFLTGQGDIPKESTLYASCKFATKNVCSGTPRQCEGNETVAEKQIPLLKTKTDLTITREIHEKVVKCDVDRPSVKPPLLPKPQTAPKPLTNLPRSACISSKPVFTKKSPVNIPPERNGKIQATSPRNKLHIKAPVAKLEEFDNFCDGPLRPPRSPKTQPFKGEPFKIFEEKPELPLKKKQLNFPTSNFQTQWQITKEKSASLSRTQAFRYVEAKEKSASLGRNKEVDFSSFATNKSDLENKSIPIPPPRQKKKQCNHSITIPVYAQVNYSAKKNRRPPAAQEVLECTLCQEELTVVEGKLILPGANHIENDETKSDQIAQLCITQTPQVDTKNVSPINSETVTLEVCQLVAEQISQSDSSHVHLTDTEVTQSQEVNRDKVKLELSENGSVLSEDKTISSSDVIRPDNGECSDAATVESSDVNCNHIQGNNSQLYHIVRLKSLEDCFAHNSDKSDLVKEDNSQTDLEDSVFEGICKELESEKCVADDSDEENTSQESQVQNFDNSRSGKELHCEQVCINYNSNNQVYLHQDCRLSTLSLPTGRVLEMKEPGKFHQRRQSWSNFKDNSTSCNKCHPHKYKSRARSFVCDDGNLSSGVSYVDSSDNASHQSSFDEVQLDGSDIEDSGPVRSKLSCWLGSFGKGHRKHKARRNRNSNSQFYCDSQESSSENKQDTTLQVPQNTEVEVKDVNQDVDESFDIYPQSESENEAEQNEDSRDESLFESEESRLNKKAFYIAQELMTSERAFIDVLKLLNVDFRHAVRAASSVYKYSVIPSVELDKILNSLPQLQHLNEDLLRDLESRIENWCSVKKIADVIVRKGPFLKLYTSYIKNFEFQCSYLEDCCQKYPKFAKVVKEFEASPRCQKLSLKHYMLKPVQRIPQYRLLLEDYLHNLTPSSPDLEDTKAALKIVCDVADHANRSIKLGDHLSKLLQLQSQLGNYEIIKPGRVFLKDGELFKLSRKGMQPRYFILLNDCLLYTSYNGSVQSSSLKVNYELPLSSMKVNTPQAEDYRNEFSIISVRRSFTLSARSLQERQEWVDMLQKAITDYASRQKTFQNTKFSSYPENENSAEPFKLGHEAPVWIQDRRVTMCQSCTAEFTVTFRRHHCRACGKVVCGDCSDYRAPLEYMRFQSARVCEDCHDALLKEANDPSSKMYSAMKQILGNGAKITDYFKRLGPPSGRKIKKYIPQRLKEVTANDTGSQMSGWLQRKSRRSWKRLWFVLKEQVLYVYKASEDVVALDSLPVLGYTVEPMKKRHSHFYEGIDTKLVFQLIHPGQQPFIFYADNEHLATRWIAAMSDATVLK
ncbi:hypothetical protein L9F63_013518 [Diploptera punctata]|uniref:FYVE, RhoGEF and PH domain-containing protein 6 n=1 Tax=Diploptera punctata TaxID=6984 RepID=A0AAD8A9S8_DIPPU|nr:hypothetical protein L9F63_013518 [Diploptera punctata]